LKSVGLVSVSDQNAKFYSFQLLIICLCQTDDNLQVSSVAEDDLSVFDAPANESSPEVELQPIAPGKVLVCFRPFKMVIRRIKFKLFFSYRPIPSPDCCE